MALIRCGAGSSNIIEFVSSTDNASITINNALDYANFAISVGASVGHDAGNNPFTISAIGGTVGTINENISDTARGKYCQSGIITPTDNTLTISTNISTSGGYPLLVVYGVRK